MILEEITYIKNGKSSLNFPGTFVYGSTLITEDKMNLSELIENISWDCLSAVGTIIKKEDIEPLKKEFNTYLNEYVSKEIEEGDPEEDVTTLLIYKINDIYYSFILYMYNNEYAINTFDSIGYEENNLMYIGGDNDDYDLVESIVYNRFEYDEDEGYGTLKNEDNVEKIIIEFYKNIILWVKDKPEWESEYKILTEGFED